LIIAIAPASFVLNLPVRVTYTKLVWVAVALSIPKAMRRPECKIKLIQFPHLLFYNPTGGNREDKI